ncbi:hypothetical protein N8Z47_02520 [Salibacteraceae bacterium]|nr:hypothetical protein [Salibacteraceae bacterium]
MRKSAFIFAMFYLLSVVGYGLEIHYCLGQIADVNIAWLDTSCACDDAHIPETSNCCDEKEFFVQVKDEHQSSSVDFKLDFDQPLIAIVDWMENPRQDIEDVEWVNPNNNGPPEPEDLYKQNCAFIYYG